MTADRIKELTRQGDAAHAAAEALDREIATAIADGVDEMTLAEMRQRRRQLVEQSEDLSEAIAVLQARGDDPRTKEREQALSRARQHARRQADNYVTSAAAVDECLAELERRFESLSTNGRELARALNASGVGDSARISNTLTPSLRWALWRNSPAFSKAADISHTPFAKRRSLADSARRVIPSIPSE